MKKRSKVTLCISLFLCLISVIAAGAIQTDMGNVEMSEISLETQAGTLTGYLFRPAAASSARPAPAIVASHGYLNNREMQDCNYIELARRGYVVIAMNAYGHGDSDVAKEAYKDTPEVESGGMIEFVRYLATLPYVDASQIGVTGHSMGGGYTVTTMHYFTELELEALAHGTAEEAHQKNLVNTGVVVGNYPNIIVTENRPLLCSFAVIEAKFDEFFYGSSLELLSSDATRTIISLQTGKPFTGTAEEGFFYTNEETGRSVAFYNPSQFHATNHFSTKVVGYLISAFEHSMPAPNPIPASSQVWLAKEIFNLVGLIGMFLFIVPFTELLLEIPFFAELKASRPDLQQSINMKKFVRSNVISGLIITILTVPFLLLGYLLLINPVWPQDTTGGVGLWCVISGLVGLICVRSGFGRKFKGNGKELYVAIGWKKFWKTLLLGLIVSSVTYGLVFSADFINQTDFRFWTFDIRVFSANKVWVMVKYLPFFAAYYVVNALAVSRASYQGWSETRQMVITALFNIMAPALILIITYVPTIFLHKTLWVALLGNATGVLALLPSAMALIPILMIPFVPILAIAAFLGVKLYRRTNSIWPAAIINTLLITMITVANTSFSFPY